jgi:hypothetical protein
VYVEALLESIKARPEGVTLLGGVLLAKGITVCAGSLILRRAVAVDEGPSRLVILSGGPSLSLFDMFLSTGGGSGT